MKKGPNRDLNAGPRTGSPEARIIPNYSLVEDSQDSILKWNVPLDHPGICVADFSL
jgi:hypothetical protein